MNLPVSASSLYDRVSRVIPKAEWLTFQDDVEAILELKRRHNAVILAHNYQTPEIFHGVADIVGDSLALARKAVEVDAVLHHVDLRGVDLRVDWQDVVAHAIGHGDDPRRTGRELADRHAEVARREQAGSSDREARLEQRVIGVGRVDVVA